MKMEELKTVLVKCPVVDGGDQWVMIELQGTIRLESSSNPQQQQQQQQDDDENEEQQVQGKRVEEMETLDGRKMGQLTFEHGVPILEIGFHRLEGKMLEIKKPFAVVRRVKGKGEGEEAHLKILGLVRQKILFKTRPKPLVGKRVKK